MQPSYLVSVFVKGVLALSVLPSILASDPAHAVRITDEPNGFNEYAWGSPLASFPALQQARELGKAEGGERIVVYEKPGEVVTLNGVPLSAVRYRFVDGELESIVLSYEGRESREKLMQWVEEHYGKLTPSERRQERRDAPVHLAGHPVPPVRFQSRGRRDAVKLAAPAFFTREKAL